jgi:glycosyltransferase involved in cell wall biosynthesis
MLNKDSYPKKSPSQRKRILLISDDIRANSGIAQVAREMVINTCHHYNFSLIAGSVTHPEKGKILDISKSINEQAKIDDAQVKMYPSDGYGNPELIRAIMEHDKPDALFFITDPRHYIWLFNMENEIRKKIPMIYLSIWDNFPAPYYNYPYYKSCDALLGISKQTHLIHQLVLGEDEIENKVLKYIPHGINDNVFKPLEKNSKEVLDVKKQILGNKNYKFILLFNSRNMRRKQIPDTLMAWKYFLDNNPEIKNDVAFILHTSAVESHGTDLNKVIDLLFSNHENRGNVYINENSFSSEQMNALYNLSDAQILLSSNEGWGLSLTEALLVGNPIIANVTGGMQDQLGFRHENISFTPSREYPTVNYFINDFPTDITHNEWSYPVFPVSQTMQGSPPTPYIFDDRCTPKDAATQINSVYHNLEELKSKKQEIRQWVQDMGFNSSSMGGKLIEAIDLTLENFKPRESFEILNTSEYKSKTLNHKL